MSYEQLMLMQGVASLVFLACLLAGAVYLVLGLVRPLLVRRAGRGGVVLVTLAVWLTGLVILGGVIGFTHSHPNGPHAVSGYIDDYFASECAKGVDLPACKTAPPSSVAQQP
jgi:hypothetical protein